MLLAKESRSDSWGTTDTGFNRQIGGGGPGPGRRLGGRDRRRVKLGVTLDRVFFMDVDILIFHGPHPFHLMPVFSARRLSQQKDDDAGPVPGS